MNHGTTYGYKRGCRCELCRAAKAADSKARYVANPERQLAANKAWREANPEYYKNLSAANPDRNRAYSRAWRAANLERARTYDRERHAANPERSRAQGRVWQAANPERRRANEKRWRDANPLAARLKDVKRRGLKMDAGVFVVADRDWHRLCARWNNACAYCGSKEPLTQDHIIPLSRGGRHSIGNLLPACRSCNSRKATRLLIEWRSELRRVA